MQQNTDETQNSEPSAPVVKCPSCGEVLSDSQIADVLRQLANVEDSEATEESSEPSQAGEPATMMDAISQGMGYRK